MEEERLLTQDCCTDPYGLIHDPVGVGLYIEDPHGLIHDPVASAFILTNAVGCSQSKACFIIMDTKLNTTRVPVQ